MMKKRLTKVFGFTAALSLLFPTLTSAYQAQDAFFNSQGFSKTTIAAMPWWEDSTVAGLGYSTILSDARAKWDAASAANVGYSKKTSADSATLRFYVHNDANVNYYGVFKPYDSSGTAFTDADVENPNKSFYKGNLVIANYYIQHSPAAGGGPMNRTQTLDVAIHEIGHSLSLRHQPDSEVSVMAISKVTSYGSPQTLDYSNIDYKY
ncbi:zinc-dependent metalloprotease family protein [Paenibacillus wynnii]|nr:zinc-dependent metalloprotease family protein [Paenibacillus wynnii]